MVTVYGDMLIHDYDDNIISNALHVRWKLKEVHAHVCVHVFFAEDVQLLVRVDRDQQCSDIGLCGTHKTQGGTTDIYNTQTKNHKYLL